jgi:hypothetical protein
LTLSASIPNPRLKIPVLQHGSFVLTESAAIHLCFSVRLQEVYSLC